MKFQLFTILGLFAIFLQTSATITEQQIEEEWAKFKQTFDKSYDLGEEQTRKNNFIENLNLIESHNQRYESGESSYQLGINQFADWTRKEFSNLVRRKSGPNPILTIKRSSSVYVDDNIDDLPEEVDWVKKGVVTPVQNMGNCGDGYAFGPVATLESAYALKTGELVELSVQQVVDCSLDENWGCQGGLIDFTFDYIKSFHGLDTEKSYPYVANYSNECQANNKKIGATMKTYVDLPRFNEQTMQSAVAKIGPVAISLDADSPHFMLYKSGVYDYQDCNMILIDHGMAVVGYGKLNGKEYWKVKNSMGTKWGVDGYLLIARNQDNLCGIASTPSYPVV